MWPRSSLPSLLLTASGGRAFRRSPGVRRADPVLTRRTRADGHDVSGHRYPGEQKLGVITHAGQPPRRLTLRARNIVTGSTSVETTVDISGPPGNHTAGALLFAALAVPRAVRTRRRWIPLALTSASAASLAVAITARVLSPTPINGVDPASVQAAQQAAGITVPGSASVPEWRPPTPTRPRGPNRRPPSPASRSIFTCPSTTARPAACSTTCVPSTPRWSISRW